MIHLFEVATAGLSHRAFPRAGAPATPPRTSLVADRRERTLLTGALAAFLVYAGMFIYRTSFVVDGERYFSLFDDAMVSMRYAKNLADGYGLVWNPGAERVEGFTNPLWVLYMALIHLLPIPPSKMSLAIQVTAAGLLALNLHYVRRIALAISGSRSVAWGAVALTALYLPINFWSLEGMEVSVLVLLITMCTWLAIDGLDSGRFPRTLYVLLGLGTLVRPDMVVPLAAVASFMLVADPAHRLRHLAWGGGFLTITIAGQALLRLWYFGDVLPNTYYLKMTGVPLAVRLTRGLYVLLQFVWRANPLLFLITLILALRRDRRIWLLFWLLTAQLAYSVYVGGDAWEYWGGSNRYISIAMSGFFVLLSCALYLVASLFTRAVATNRWMRLVPTTVTSVIFTLVVIYAIISLNSIQGHGALAEAALIRPPLHTGTGAGNDLDVRLALLLRDVTSPEASVGVLRAGTVPYFVNRYAIDLFGKTDSYVAHGPAKDLSGRPVDFRNFRPGHMKFDFDYSIGRLQPDVILHLGAHRAAVAKPFLDAGDYIALAGPGGCLYVRRHSPRVLWDRLPNKACALDTDPISPQP